MKVSTIKTSGTGYTVTINAPGYQTGMDASDTETPAQALRRMADEAHAQAERLLKRATRYAKAARIAEVQNLKGA